jgi:hypothetical protein
LTYPCCGTQPGRTVEFNFILHGHEEGFDVVCRDHGLQPGIVLSGSAGVVCATCLQGVAGNVMAALRLLVGRLHTLPAVQVQRAWPMPDLRCGYCRFAGVPQCPHQPSRPGWRPR